MLFRQFFTPSCSAYSYILADQEGGDALIIDPVRESLSQYQQFIEQTQLQLRYALDTHIHADHVTALGELRNRFHCQTLMGEQANAACVTKKYQHGDEIVIGNVSLHVLYTPGHTDDSYCFYTRYKNQGYLFTGDTLLIRGTGRTDFQNGDAGSQFDSIQQLFANYDDATLVYPGHDYKGWSVSTIGEERRFNPRLKVADRNAYVSLMKNLNMPLPQQMAVAVPANRRCGELIQ